MSHVFYVHIPNPPEGHGNQTQIKMKRLLSAVITVLCLMMTGHDAAAKKQIVVNTEPAGAEVLINGVSTHRTTPMMLPYPKGKQFQIGFRKAGYEDGKMLVVKQKQFDGKKDFPPELSYRLTPAATPQTSYTKDPTIVKGEATNRVSRDNPGTTALEQTIIRWAIDSEPRGARIFYRVISSIPAEVKNTNETYLMTTPYEETRAFDILGLTYENSRNVTIEFKVSKAGYESQVKRFNVRQAIDQQEISSFFELVKKEAE